MCPDSPIGNFAKLRCIKCIVGQFHLKYEGETKIVSQLICETCAAVVRVKDDIPIFVEAEDNYAENFGYEWNKWGALQVDAIAGHRISERRFFRDTKWKPDWLSGKRILDAGCGAGRFSDVAGRYGANLVALDLSSAIFAAKVNLGHLKSEPLFIQASLYEIPLEEKSFDAVYCFGVIQHTPDPRGVIENLVRYLKPGGIIVCNYYEKTIITKFQFIKYPLRAITRDLGNKPNLVISYGLTLAFFPFSYVLSLIPGLRFFNSFLPICSSHYKGLSIRNQFFWTLLDTFDWYSPKFEIRQDSEYIETLLRSLGLTEVSARDGVARGTSVGE